MAALLVATVALIPWAAPAQTPPVETDPAPAAPLFEDRARASGVDFVHFAGRTGRLLFPETVGAGGALLDYDGDGDLDLYLVQGALLDPEATLADALDAPYPRPTETPRDRLLRNDLQPAEDGGPPVPVFVDVTDRAGIDARGYGIGATVGDPDGDGDGDLYITQYGSNLYLENRGDGTFEDATARAGLDDPRWSTSAAFVDLTGDGLQDLFVVNYVAYSAAEATPCFSPTSRLDYCGPSSFQAVPDRLFVARGDGTFEDATARLLGPHRAGAGLGVTTIDLDGDGRQELYVANDGHPNHLWVRSPTGTWRDEALLAGVAVNRSGVPEAGMGVSAGDPDGDGDEDLVLVHLTEETNTYYENEGGGLFTDRSVESGLGPPSLPWTGFGAAWTDVDGDGDLDLPVLHGAIRLQEEGLRAGAPYPLGQPDQLFLNRGDGTFVDASAATGFDDRGVGRGLAPGDLDGDGDEDLLATRNVGPARLLFARRDASAPGEPPWTGVALLGPGPALGAATAGTRVEVRSGPGEPGAAGTSTARLRTARTDGSYAVARDPRVLVSLGPASPESGAPEPRLESVRLALPGGKVLELREPPPRRWLVVPVTAPERAPSPAPPTDR